MGTSYEQRYDWQYLHNPAGKGSILFAYEGEKPVGQIASIPSSICVSGRDDLNCDRGRMVVRIAAVSRERYHE